MIIILIVFISIALVSCDFCSSDLLFKITDNEGVLTLPSNRTSVLGLTIVNNGKSPLTVLSFKNLGTPSFNTLERLVSSLISDKMSENEKAFVLFDCVVDWIYHYYPAFEHDNNYENHDVIKLFNVYGYGFCDDVAIVFSTLALYSGLDSRVVTLGGHTVCELYYSGKWHLFDPDNNMVFFLDSGEVASINDLLESPELIDEADFSDRKITKKLFHNLVTTTENNRIVNSTKNSHFKKTLLSVKKHSIQPILQPGDTVAFYFESREKVRPSYYENVAHPPKYANGTIKRNGTAKFVKNGLYQIDFEWPYVLLDGEYRFDAALIKKQPNIFIKLPERDEYHKMPIKTSSGKYSFNISAWLGKVREPIYSYSVYIDFGGAVNKDQAVEFECIHDFQFSPMIFSVFLSKKKEVEYSLVSNSKINVNVIYHFTKLNDSIKGEI